MTTTTTLRSTPTTAAPEPAPRRRRFRADKEGYRVNWWLTALMLVASLTVLVPLYFAVVMALKTPEQIANGSGFELPSPVQWSNFSEAFTLVDFPTAFMVTALVTVVTVLGATVTLPGLRERRDERRDPARHDGPSQCARGCTRPDRRAG